MERTYENRFEDRIATDQPLDLTFGKDASGSLVIFLEGENKEITIDLKAEAYSYTKIFIQNRMEHELTLTIKADVENDAKIEMGLLDLQDEELILKADGSLNSQGATMELSTAQLSLAKKKKKANIELTSHTAHTYGNIHNFAVVYNEGQYEMVAAGRIDKGAFGSESHQETRVLTMGKDHTVITLPILYIDENDVKASHALTVGQPDADQLYYLQSRGLSTMQAMGLLAIGYFKPVAALIDDESLRQQLQEEIEVKAGLYEH